MLPQFRKASSPAAAALQLPKCLTVIRTVRIIVTNVSFSWRMEIEQITTTFRLLFT